MKSPITWFRPREEPVLELLAAQWESVATTVDAVLRWSRGSTGLPAAQAVLEVGIEREREQRRLLHRRVRAAFWTPLDSEDIYELGERIGMLHRQLDLLVREADASRTPPDAGLAGILTAVADAVTLLGTALTILPDGHAATVADEACELLETADDAYRAALTGMAHDDIRLEMGQRELYRRAEHVADAATRVGHRAWYAVCKIS